MNRAIAPLAAAAAVLVACVTNTAIQSAKTQSGVSMTAPTIAPTPGVFTPLGLDSDHAGFPTATVLPDGNLRVMWRHGSQHISDGEVLTSLSTDDGRTWTQPEPVVVDGSSDFRDPHLATVGADVFLTFFVSVDGAPTGARVARSTDGGTTWEPSVRIDPDMPYAAISSPVIQVGGKLWTGFYGRKPGEAVDSAYAAWSTDSGQTWSTVRIAVGYAGNPYQEPWTVEGNNGTVVYIFRDGTWRTLATRVFDTTAGKWAPATRGVIANATGNSSAVRAADGGIYLVYRDTQTRAAKLAVSTNNGAGFTLVRELMPKPAGATSAVGMTYAHPIQLGNGYIFCPLGMERSNTDSRIYLGYL